MVTQLKYSSTGSDITSNLEVGQSVNGHSEFQIFHWLMSPSASILHNAPNIDSTCKILALHNITL